LLGAGASGGGRTSSTTGGIDGLNSLYGDGKGSSDAFGGYDLDSFMVNARDKV
jgi:hypothetical protein